MTTVRTAQIHVASPVLGKWQTCVACHACLAESSGWPVGALIAHDGRAWYRFDAVLPADDTEAEVYCPGVN